MYALALSIHGAHGYWQSRTDGVGDRPTSQLRWRSSAYIDSIITSALLAMGVWHCFVSIRRHRGPPACVISLPHMPVDVSGIILFNKCVLLTGVHRKFTEYTRVPLRFLSLPIEF